MTDVVMSKHPLAFSRMTMLPAHETSQGPPIRHDVPSLLCRPETSSIRILDLQCKVLIGDVALKQGKGVQTKLVQ